MNNQLVYKVDEKACREFTTKYPKVTELMKASKGRTLKSAYVRFLDAKDKIEPTLGGSPEVVNSPTFGTKTFWKYDFCGASGWAEVFQYVKSK